MTKEFEKPRVRFRKPRWNQVYLKSGRKAPHYQVSNTGLVRSRKSGEWRLLKFGRNENGSRSVGLSLPGGTCCRSPVGTLVYIAFRGFIPSGMVVLHIDRDPTNNHISNLRCGTLSDVQEGLKRKRQRFSNAELELIHRLLRRKRPRPSIASRLGVPIAVINMIAQGRHYTDFVCEHDDCPLCSKRRW